MKMLLTTLLGLPLFVVLGALAMVAIAYGFENEDPGTPSSSVTVLGIWESAQDGSLCRAFQYDELLAHIDTLSIRLGVTADDLDQCRQAFASYDRSVGWPRKVWERERNYEGFALEVEDTEPVLALTIRRFHGDAMSATTRYRVDPEGVISNLETSGTGPGAGIGPVLGGLAGAIVWSLWAAVRLMRAWRKSRTKAPVVP